MSKFIPHTIHSHNKSFIKPKSEPSYKWHDVDWKYDPKSKTEIDSYKPKLSDLEQPTFKSEKIRLTNISVDDISFKDIYKFPLHQAKYGSWVYDKSSNFIFQFQFNDKETQKQIIEILNDEFIPNKKIDLKYEDGMIYFHDEDKWKEFILMRGWGNLTGIGSYDLDGDRAAKIQDSLAEHIIHKLTDVEKD